MFSRKSALSSDETVKSARQRHKNFDQQRARAYKRERMFQTYLVLNKKKKNTFILVCGRGQGSCPIKKIAWQFFCMGGPPNRHAWPPQLTSLLF